jgi:peptidoglycan/LPS O-acetylase OafA/YrhL
MDNMLLIPRVGPGDSGAFPLNGASWSLFAELVVNTGFALFAVRMSRTALAWATGFCFCLFAVTVLHRGSADIGQSQSDVVLAVVRAAPSFLGGVLLYRFHESGRFSGLPAVWPIAPLGAWLLIAAIDLPSCWLDLIAIGLLAPLSLVSLASRKTSTPRWALVLGALSYPLYATHDALVVFAGRSHVFDAYLGHPAVPVTILAILCLALAEAVRRWYEPVARHGLRRLVDGRAARGEAVGPAAAT